MEEFLKKYGITNNSQLIAYKIKNIGKDANKIKNPMIIDKENQERYIMYCESNTEIYLDDNSLEKIIQFEKDTENELVFYKLQNGYIATTLKNRKILYIHQIITGCYGNGRGTKQISVDHIDQNPLNNCFTNLRVVDRKIQEQNSKGIKEGTKRARKKSAKPLPEGITHDMMLKYVVYYKEMYNKEKELYREYFKIEKHPKLQKCWIGSKSNKITIKEKLDMVNKVVSDLENDIYPQTS
jgi:hypothetical protein